MEKARRHIARDVENARIGTVASIIGLPVHQVRVTNLAMPVEAA
jgi:hypothetical protein